MANDNISAGTVITAFALGALTGAAVALLFAPASGEETREFLGQKARESRDKARDAMEQGREYYNRQKENLASAVDRGREAFQAARERGDQA
jgi:gas vesicle protein